MILSQAIINCMDYKDTEEFMYSIYAKRRNGKFQPDSEALVLKLTVEEMEIKSTELAEEKCPGFDYFLEIFVLKDFYEDLLKLEEFKSDAKKVERIIYYAEFDA
ncbi:hypothetical protein BC749_1217 [Flavobacterium araucananum]|uniref:Uncharacterized protein n=2 Tax=Flavobacterium araucananum TaxID=946678 RepID=A0A227P8P1_9FLAO|nr:hypothetical protein B0A64_12060 [Flavobacterium araucananum]PWJ90097.1 hypothetical protein BC749_1217 [Flavobacterium araucananum]